MLFKDGWVEMGVVMSTKDDDIDVLAQLKEKASPAQRYVKAADAKILPPLAQYCECELLVTELGKALVVFNKTLPEGIHWAEYDMDLSLLTFVTWSGDIMGLGMKIHPPFRKYFKMADSITMVQMTEDKAEILVSYDVDLVIRNIGI